MEPTIFNPNKDYKDKQEALTDLNAAGNKEPDTTEHLKCGTPDCCGKCDTADFGDHG